MSSYLGLDLGTSGLKALLVDDHQAVLATASVPLATSQPRPGWSEQQPAAWWAAAETAIAMIRRDAASGFAALAGIGLSGQMHGAVPLGRDGQALRPAMLWNDGRAVAECAELQAAVPGLAALAGAQAVPGYTAPKLLWLRRHEPAVFAAIHKILLPKDYLRLALTGDYATDLCDAAGALLLDEAKRSWALPVVEACGLDREHLPALAEGSAVTGFLRPALAAAWGLAGRRIPVAAGAGDAAAGAIGIGAIGGDDAYFALGTAAQLFVSTEAYRPAPATLLQNYAHGVPERWFQSGAVLNGASCLAWAASLLNGDIETLLAETEAAFDGPGRLLFLPYLTGERLPHNDPDARGVLFGLSPDSGRTAVIQAVLEGVGFTLQAAHACLNAAGTPVAGAAVVGGGARSGFWTRIIADITGLALTRYAGGAAGPAFGATRLARLAVTGESPAAVCLKPPVLDVTVPDPARHEAYRARSTRFERLYRALKAEYQPSA